jgi:ubiquitin C-terminal hydrolase
MPKRSKKHYCKKHSHKKHHRKNNEYAILPSGFVNMGSTCYFNATLQSLLGCTSLTKLVLTNEDVQSRNNFTRAYRDMLYDCINGTGMETVSWSKRIWKEFTSQLKIQGIGKKFGKSTLIQEDSQECLVLMLECFQSVKVDSLFKHQYELTTFCLSCDRVCSKKIDDGFMVDVSLSEIKSRSFIGLQNYIAEHYPDFSKDADYKCPHCGIKGLGTKSQRRKLVRMPEILIVQFKKYVHLREDKWIGDFPTRMNFPRAAVAYKIVSQTEQGGTMSSGHYWARSLRRNDKIFMLNDENISESTWEPTVHTYMVWYQGTYGSLTLPT